MSFADALARLRKSAGADMRTHATVTVRQTDLGELLHQFDRLDLEARANERRGRPVQPHEIPRVLTRGQP
jgi:hypothetical protein